jgi:hypothetical protein
MSEDIDKAEAKPVADLSRLPQEVGQPYIVDGFSLIRQQKKRELSPANLPCTFREMLNDADVADALDSILVKTLPALEKGVIKAKSDSPASKENAEFLNYTIRNMSQGTWLEAMQNASTCLIHGYALINPVLEFRTYGKYKNKVVLKKLAPRTQSSVYGWAWDNKGRDLKGVIQKPMKLVQRNSTLGSFSASKITYSGITSGFYKDSKYTFIPSKKLLHFRFNPTDNNPQGYSPLFVCYDAYAEKKLIEQYELIGASKDLGGIGVVEMPMDMMTKATQPEVFPAEAAAYEILLKTAADVQNAKGNLIVLASDVDPNTKSKLYDFKIKGVDGGGKQYKTSEIIEIKRKSIYNVFGAGFKILGQSGHGSNALSSNQMSTHDYYVQRLLMWVTDVINNQLLPMILEANGIELDWEDMPTFVPDDPTKADEEVLGKLVSRLASGGLMTEAVHRKILEDMELPTEGIEDIDYQALRTGGSGSEGSGNGSSQKEGGGSDTNNENAS